MERRIENAVRVEVLAGVNGQSDLCRYIRLQDL
jgi:hypothetical protein